MQKPIEELTAEEARAELVRAWAMWREKDSECDEARDWAIAANTLLAAERERAEELEEKVRGDIHKLVRQEASQRQRAEKAEELLRGWAPILEAAQRQDIKWKKPMPEIDFGDEGIHAWALKAQEEMGELSAALLGGLIGKEGRGDVLEECYQLIAVLLRIAESARAALPKE